MPKVSQERKSGVNILKNRKGNVLFTAVLILIILGISALAFSMWLAIQSKGTTHKRIVARARYDGEAAVQKALNFIQNNAAWQTALTDDYPTHYFLMNIALADGTTVYLSVWDVP